MRYAVFYKDKQLSHPTTMERVTADYDRLSKMFKGIEVRPVPELEESA